MTTDATRVREQRPWPVVLLIGLGAWLAAIPLIVALALLLGDALKNGPLAYLMGLLLIAAAVVVLRARGLPIFIEQLALPALLVGGGGLAFGLYRDASFNVASVAMAIVAIAIALAIGQSWLRALLGAAAAIFTVVACIPKRALELDPGAVSSFWMAWHFATALWLAGVALLARKEVTSASKRNDSIVTGSALESLLGGWGMVTLVGLAWLAGMTFLAGAVLPAELARELATTGARRWLGGPPIEVIVSGALAVAAAAVSARRWPELRRVWCAGVAVVLVALSMVMPMLGAVVLILSVSLARRRRFHALAAALAVVWIIGAFYYRLEYPLAEKALMLFSGGVLLSVLAGIGARGARSQRSQAAASASAGDANRETPANPLGGVRSAPRTAIGIAAALVATLAIANFGIWQKETLIANGRPLYVALGPVDPRSLMQGDYMALTFRLPPGTEDLPDDLMRMGRPRIIVRQDARGVAESMRLDSPDRSLSADEMPVELAHRAGGWMLVTDAWFFKEGDGERWSQARFGEFRVNASGQALLVGMADKDLQPIVP